MMLENKVVVVSGIGPGLGQELSTLAAREGAAAVVLAARTASKLDTAEREIRDLGLATVNRLPPLKKLFIKHAMGLVGDLPRLMRGETL